VPKVKSISQLGIISYYKQDSDCNSNWDLSMMRMMIIIIKIFYT